MFDENFIVDLKDCEEIDPGTLEARLRSDPVPGGGEKNFVPAVVNYEFTAVSVAPVFEDRRTLPDGVNFQRPACP